MHDPFVLLLQKQPTRQQRMQSNQHIPSSLGITDENVCYAYDDPKTSQENHAGSCFVRKVCVTGGWDMDVQCLPIGKNKACMGNVS